MLHILHMMSSKRLVCVLKVDANSVSWMLWDCPIPHPPYSARVLTIKIVNTLLLLQLLLLLLLLCFYYCVFYSGAYRSMELYIFEDLKYIQVAVTGSSGIGYIMQIYIYVVHTFVPVLVFAFCLYIGPRKI